LERFLKISKSTTLPPDDPEILHLASKVAYILSVYDFFDSEEYQKKLPYSDGAKVWFSLAQAAKGEGELALKTLEDVLHITEESGDLLLRIECLGILAQILFVRGSKSKEKLESILDKIQIFKQKNENLEDFNQMFLSAYLIQSRISSQQLQPDKIVEKLTPLNSIAKKVGDSYFTMQLTMDLIMALLSAKEIDNAQKLLDEVFQTLTELKYNALKAKATKILGQLQEAKNDYTSAEKTYLEAKEMYLKLDDQIGVAGCVSQLAHLSEKEEQLNKAEQYYNEALALSEKMSDYFGVSIALSALARLSAKKSQYSDALKKYKKVLTIAEENKFEHLLPSIYDGLAYVNFIAGDFKSSVKNRELTI
ncbi:MAG: tetratricopeptide repeat protein, partial [Candidatus Heimdallarchaeota archaeon]